MITTTFGILEAARNGGHIAAFRALQPSSIDESFAREELVLDIIAELEKFDAIAVRIMEGAGATKNGTALVFEDHESPVAVAAMQKIQEMRARSVSLDFSPIEATSASLGAGRFSPMNLAALRDCGIILPSKKERKPSLE